MPVRRVLLLLVIGLLAHPASAADVELAGFHRVLLPLYIPDPVKGLFGATFSTDLLLPLYSESPLRIFPSYSGGPAPVVGDYRPGYPVVFFDRVSSAGRFVFFDRTDVRVINRAKSTNAVGQVLGVTLDPVWPASFLSATGYVLAVPNTFSDTQDPVTHRPVPAERRTLWIFSSSYVPGDRFRVALLPHFGPPPAPDVVLEVTTESRDGDDLSYPVFARVALPDICIPVSSHTPCRDIGVIVRIEPLDPTSAFWAMVTVVDNSTQAIQVYRVQP